MARLTDQDVRDAEHALRSEVALILGRYSRRLLEEGKAHIQTAIAEAEKEERDVNGTEIGRAAAERAAFQYFGGLADQVAILGTVEGETPPALEA